MDGFSSSSPASSAASSCHRPLSYPQRSAAPRRMQCGRAALVVRRSRPCVRPSLMLWRLHRGRPPCPAASCSSSATPADITSNTVFVQDADAFQFSGSRASSAGCSLLQLSWVVGAVCTDVRGQDDDVDSCENSNHITLRNPRFLTRYSSIAFWCWCASVMFGYICS